MCPRRVLDPRVKDEPTMNNEIKSDSGYEGEGLLLEDEAPHLELWVENPEIGEPSFRYFVPIGEDPVAAYSVHVARDDTDEVTRIVEVLPGQEWVIEVSTYAGWERIWAKWREG